jgi:hypothetical protein
MAHPRGKPREPRLGDPTDDHEAEATRACVVCGSSLEGRRPQAIYCSDGCRSADRDRERAARRFGPDRPPCPICGASMVGRRDGAITACRSLRAACSPSSSSEVDELDKRTCSPLGDSNVRHREDDRACAPLANCHSSPLTAGRPECRPGASSASGSPRTSGHIRDIFVWCLNEYPRRIVHICCAFSDAGGGTRTPDTRIMIPLL